MNTYTPVPGESFDSAAKAAIRMALSFETPVQFRFNGVELVATKYSNLAELSEIYSATLSAQKAAKPSPPQPDPALKQQAMNETLNLLFEKGYAMNHDNLMEWLKCYAELADNRGVRFQPNQVYGHFRLLKYDPNVETGRPVADYDDRAVMARYIIGQVLTFLEKGMPPHPVTLSFIAQYEALPPSQPPVPPGDRALALLPRIQALFDISKTTDWENWGHGDELKAVESEIEQILNQKSE